MSNKHTFDSIRTVEKQNFDSVLTTKRNYNSTIIKSRFYTAILPSFYQNYGLFARFIQNNVILINNMVQNISLNAHIVIEPIVLSVGLDDISRSIEGTYYFRQYNTIRAILTQSRNIGSALFLQNENVGAILSQKVVINATDKLIIEPIQVDVVLTAFQGIFLSTYDPQLLSDLDANLLSAMDGSYV